MDRRQSPANTAARGPSQTGTAAGKITVAVIDPAGLAPKTLGALFGGGRGIYCQYADLQSESGRAIAASCDAGILVDPRSKSAQAGDDWRNVLEHWRGLVLPAVVLTNQQARDDCQFANVQLAPTASSELLIGALMGLAADEQEIRLLQGQRKAAASLGDSIGSYLADMDTELRLAARLQKDFLPESGQRIGPFTLTTLFRPSNWVSGDIFDFFKLDQQHAGFYLADAMGHGVAAGLLTMYLKQRLRPGFRGSDGQGPIPPGELMAALNVQLCEQHLQDSQFVTAIYGVLNHQTLRMDYAVAGHPPLIRITPDTEPQELNADGTLLGLDANQAYETRSVDLQAGDRVIVYSDGLEPVLINARHSCPSKVEWVNGIPAALSSPADEVFRELIDRLDRIPGSLMKSDDASLMMIDVTREPAPHPF